MLNVSNHSRENCICTNICNKKYFCKIRDLLTSADYVTFNLLTWHKCCMIDDIYLAMFMEIMTG